MKWLQVEVELKVRVSQWSVIDNIESREDERVLYVSRQIVQVIKSCILG